MAGRFIQAGSTSKSRTVVLRDSATGQLKTGIAYSAVTASYQRCGAASDVTVSLSGGTLGTWLSGSWIEETQLGCYQFCLPDASIASGADEVDFKFSGTGFLDATLHVNLVGQGGGVPAVGSQMDLQNVPNPTAVTAIQLGLSKPTTAQTITPADTTAAAVAQTAIANIASGTTVVAANATKIGGQTVSASGTITFPAATLASTTNITGGTVGSVSGNVGGNLNGNVLGFVDGDIFGDLHGKVLGNSGGVIVGPGTWAYNSSGLVAFAIQDNSISNATFMDGAIDKRVSPPLEGISPVYDTAVSAVTDAQNFVLGSLDTTSIGQSVILLFGSGTNTGFSVAGVISGTSGQIRTVVSPPGGITSIGDTVHVWFVGSTVAVDSAGRVDLVNAPNSTALVAIAAAVWAYLTSAATTVGSFGKAIAQWLATLGTDHAVTISATDTTAESVAALTIAPTVEQIDTQLTSTHGSGVWGSTASGTGAYAITVHVADGTSALGSAAVRFTQGGNAYTNTTDNSGNAGFSLDSGTYTLSVTHAGDAYTPTSQTIAASATINAVMSPIGIPAPPTPSQSTGVLKTVTAAGNANPGYAVTFKAISMGATTATAAVGDPFILTSNGSGDLSGAFVIGWTYKAWNGNGNVVEFQVPVGTSFSLPSVLGVTPD